MTCMSKASCFQPKYQLYPAGKNQFLIKGVISDGEYEFKVKMDKKSDPQHFWESRKVGVKLIWVLILRSKAWHTNVDAWLDWI